MVAEYLIAVLDAEKQPSDDFYVILSPEDINPVIVRRWQSFLLQTEKGFHPVFGAWHAFAAMPPNEFSARAPALARALAANTDPAQRLNALVARAFAGAPPTSMRDVAERYGKLLGAVHRK